MCVCVLQASAGHGMVKLTSQRARKSSPTADTTVVSSSAMAVTGSIDQSSSADASLHGRPRTSEPRPPPWSWPAPQSDG